MGNSKVEAEYARLHQEGKARGDQGPQEEERRKHPRIHVDLADVSVDDSHWSFLIDLSRDGIAFHTDAEYKPGDRLVVSLEDGYTAQTEVVKAGLEEVDPSPIAQNRVSCRFVEPDQGLVLLERIKRQEAELRLDD